MTGKGSFAKGLLAGGALQNPLCRFNVHPLDQLILKSLGTALESVHQLARTLELILRRPESAMAWLDLVRMDQALAVEAQTPALLRFGDESISVVQTVEYPIEDS